MLAELPEQYGLLLISGQPLKTGGDGRGGRAVHAPLPGRLDVLNLLGPASRQDPSDGQDQVGSTPFLAVLAGWCEVVEEERRLTPCRRNATTMTNRLLTDLTWIAEQSFAGDFFGEIEELLKAAQRITMTAPVMELLRGVVCPSCERFTMVRHHPSPWAAECRLCPSVKLDQADFDALVRGQARDADDTANAGPPDGR
jgi:hypothetical protein